MEKKIYMTPQMECTQIETATMIAGSIASVESNVGIGLGIGGFGGSFRSPGLRDTWSEGWDE